MSGVDNLMIGSSLAAGRRFGHAPSALNAISGQADWNAALDNAMADGQRQSAKAPDGRLAGIRKNVEELVARTLIMPVLSSLHNNPLKSDLFPETAGSKALGPLLEAEVAKSVASSMGGSFVDQMAQRLLNELDQKSVPGVRPAR